MEVMAAEQDRFYALIWPLADVVLRTARVLCARASDAEDLAQETLMKAFRALDQFHPGTDARAWLLTILRRSHIDRLRQQKSRGQTSSLEAMELDVAAPEACPEPLDPAAWHDPAAMLARFGDEQIISAMRQLPESMAWSLLLVDVEELELTDAAELMEVPVGTVKSRLHRARAALRAILEHERKKAEHHEPSKSHHSR